MLVFLTGPLGMAGVAAALLLLNRPCGVGALRGVIALIAPALGRQARKVEAKRPALGRPRCVSRWPQPPLRSLLWR